MRTHDALDWALFLAFVGGLFAAGLWHTVRSDRQASDTDTVPATGYRLMGGNVPQSHRDTVPPSNGLSEFEQDRVARLNARYSEARAAVGSTGSALVNGSVGGTSIPAPTGYVPDYGAVSYAQPQPHRVGDWSF
jgi:hypothetical protein